MKKTINNIDCIVENPGTSRVVMLIHGFGADYRDLATLGEMLDPDSKWTWVFPNGPLSVALGMGMEGRAWFSIPIEELQREMETGVRRDYSDQTPKGFEKAIQQMEGLIFELLEEYDEIVIGGFSQGAMMASHLLGACGEKLKGAIFYSTAMLDTKRLDKSLAVLKPVPFIQSHGRQDSVLYINNGKKLYDHLKEKGWKGEWIEFNGGHEIPMPVLARTVQFLKGL